jgi:hypothetical protein
VGRIASAGVPKAPRGASVRRSTDWATANESNAVVSSFDIEEYDTDGLFDPAAPDRFTVPAALAGRRARIGGMVIWPGSMLGSYRELKIFRNGDDANPIAVNQIADESSIGTNIGQETESRPIELAAGDFFQLCARQNSGGALSVLAAPSYSLTFWIQIEGTGGDGPAGPTGATGATGPAGDERAASALVGTGGDLSVPAGGAFADVGVNGLERSITLDSPRRLMIGVIATAYCAGATGSVFLDVTIDGVRQGADGGLAVYNQHATASEAVPMNFVYVTPTEQSAGVHTVRLQAKALNTTATIEGGTGGGAAYSLWVSEV